MARKAAAQIDEEAKPLDAPSPVLTEPIEIEVKDEPSPSVEIVTPAEPAPPKPAEAPATQVEADPAIKRRLDEMERSNADLARRNAELTKQNTVGRQQYANEQQQRFAAEYDATINSLGAAESIIDAAKQEVRSARAEGDIDREVEAQDKWNEASANKRFLTAKRDQMDNWLEQQKARPAPQQQQPQQQPPTEADLRGHAETAISQFQAPDRVKNWLRNHMEYMTDPAKNNKLQVIHGVVVDEGYEAYSEPYVERMEELLGMRKVASNGSGNGAQRQSASSVNVSAPPTREAPSMTTGRTPTSTKVTLSAEERGVAAMVAESRGISQAEAEQEYAKQKIEMNRRKAQNGG